jgi:hypothetical protein
MAEHHLIVSAPTGTGGRRIEADDVTLGTAYRLHDVAVLLQRAGLGGWDELDVIESPLIEWYGGGPEEWFERPSWP